MTPLRRPPAMPHFTFGVLIVLFVVTVLGAVLLGAASPVPSATLLTAGWGTAAVLCGFRPLWDADYRAEGGRLAHVVWYFRHTLGAAGLALLVLPTALLGLYFAAGIADRPQYGWATGFLILAAACVAVLIATEVRRADVGAALRGLVVAVVLAVLPILVWVTLWYFAYAAGPIVAVYLLGVGVSWVWLRGRADGSAGETSSPGAMLEPSEERP